MSGLQPLTQEAVSRSSLPRKIFTYWHQGMTDAPPIVRACVAQMIAANPGWTVEVLDEESASSTVEQIPLSTEKMSRLGLAHRSDLLRTKLLLDSGGVWIDPTVFVARPLEGWLPSKMDAGMFFFSHPGRDRLISNWFIASSPGNRFLANVLDEMCAYWEKNSFRNLGRPANKTEKQINRLINRSIGLTRLWFTWPFTKVLKVFPYMVYHYMVARLVHSDPALRDVFERMPVVSADGPHKLQRVGLLRTFDDEAERVLRDPEIPLHKLTWKAAADSVSETSTMSQLIRMAHS